MSERPRKSIRDLAFHCFAEGMSKQEAWKEAQECWYPIRVVSWSYILRLHKEYLERDSEMVT